MIQLFSRRFGSLAKPRAHRTRMKMKSPTLRSTRLLCGRPEVVRPNDVRPLQHFRNLSWAISAVGKETLHFWFLLPGFCPHSLKFACLHRTIHTVLRFSQITLSSCSLPTSRRIWATCPFFVLCVLFRIIWHRDGALTCLRAACQWWVTLISIDAQWRFEGQHFFEFPIVAAGGGKSEGLRKARSEKGFVKLRYPPTKIRLKCTNHKPMKSFLQMCLKVLWIYHCARVSRVWNIEFDRLSQMSFYKLQIVAMQTDLEWFI